MRREWVKTADGSPSLYVPELKQNYHSQHGALQESRHVFIEAGLNQLAQKEEISILEIGFGTGLNALLTHLEKANPNQNIQYHSLEKYPLSQAEWEAINWPELFTSHPSYQSFYHKLHEAAWNQTIRIESDFILHKAETDLRNFDPQAKRYDLIYFDAFSPEAQPDLWSQGVFKTLHHSLKKEGLLVTYCVKGIVRRAMGSAGFEVTKIPGPPGKREMARALKTKL